MIIAPTPETLAGQPLSVLVQMGRETLEEINNYYKAVQRLYLASDYYSLQQVKRALDVLGHVAERLGIATYDTYMDLVLEKEKDRRSSRSEQSETNINNSSIHENAEVSKEEDHETHEPGSAEF